ncbi:MAG TPA: HypC/HybG/HupF family hydrogenase formation chaperone [Streptosporangiaceae bacterium]
MCISLPGKVVTVRGPAALVETAGTRRWCNALLQESLEPGDRVLIHAGLVVQVLSPDQADEIENAFAELARLDPAIGLRPGQEGDGSRTAHQQLAVRGAENVQGL